MKIGSGKLCNSRMINKDATIQIKAANHRIIVAVLYQKYMVDRTATFVYFIMSKVNNSQLEEIFMTEETIHFIPIHALSLYVI